MFFWKYHHGPQNDRNRESFLDGSFFLSRCDLKIVQPPSCNIVWTSIPITSTIQLNCNRGACTSLDCGSPFFAAATMGSVVDTKLLSETVTVRFLQFSDNMPRVDGVEVFSPEFMCLERRWKVRIERHALAHVWLGAHLCSCEEVRHSTDLIPFSLKVRTINNRQHEQTGKIRPECHAISGTKQYARMEMIQQSLPDGALVFEVTMWGVGSSLVYVPENPFPRKMLDLFMHEESSDVTIQVGAHQGMNDNKRAKTSPTIFHAHKIMLRQGAPQLFEMCGGTHPVVDINNIEPEIFRHLLYYIYGGTIKETDLKGKEKDVIDAADRYGVVSLKLEAEACYVQSNTFTTDNFLDNLQYANSKNLALLKETVMDFALKNRKQVNEMVSRGCLPQEEANQVLALVTEHEATNGTGYGSMRVTELRHRMAGRGLAADGSRTAMIKDLRDSDAQVVDLSQG